MSVIVDITLQGVTPAQYDLVRDACGHLRSAPDGGQAHVVWWNGGDCRILDAWASEQAFGAFVETRLTPALAKAGIAQAPQVVVTPAHEVFAPAAVTVT